MTETGLVAAFTGVRRPFDLLEFPVPEAQPGAAVVRITMANVCGSDLHIWRGTYDVSRGHSEPFCLSIGHEMTGVVHELGDGVTVDSAGAPLEVGDRVVFQYF
ncbi:MAG: zinc-binding alcohol dehydrogenase, partial [Planctomycetaceae bacterium]|nr:zinc-binding alcohol dehydrogenase [Planctomycetaceae bacterium]